MISVLILATVAVISQGTPVLRPNFYSQPTVYVQPVPITYSAPVVVKNEAPKPYNFGYEAPAIGGGSSRQETSDGNGRVTGSYTVTDADGRLRVVEYYADETGFHANVKTNEPGTASQDSADVKVQSYTAPVSAPVVAPKVVERVVSPAPVYSVAPVRTVTRRVVTPVSYGVVPEYNSLSYATPVTYANDYYGNGGNFYESYSPKFSYIYK